MSGLITNENYFDIYPTETGKGVDIISWTVHWLPFMEISVMRVESDTFGNPIFQKGLQN